MKTKLALMFALLIGAAGCAPLTTKHANEYDVGEGISYYLPMRLHQVTISGTQTSLTNELRNAAANVATKTRLEAEARSTYSAAESTLRETSNLENVLDAVLQSAQSNAQQAQVALNIASAQRAQAESTYESVLIQYGECIESGCENQVAQIKLQVVPNGLIPDTNQRFIANFGDGVLSSDQLNITTTTSGLLSGTNTADSTSQVSEALGAISRLAAFRSVGDLMASSAVNATNNERSLPFRVSMLIDLTNEQDLVNLKTALGTHNIGLRLGRPNRSERLTVVQLGAGSDSSNRANREDEISCIDTLDDICYLNIQAQESYDGLVYRRELPFLLELFDSLDGDKLIAQAIAHSPNGSPLEIARIPKSFFANSTSSFSFNNGLLVDSDLSRESELAAAVAIPADLIGQYLSALSEIFGLHLNIERTTRDFYDARLENLQNQEELEDFLMSEQDVTGGN